MKKILFLFLGLTSLLAACQKDDFLEPKANALTEETVFSDSTRTMAFLTRIYADVGFSFNKGRWASHGNTEHATDDAEYFFSGAGQSAVILYSGTYTPLNLPNNDFWQTPWDNIRRCNLLLSQLPRTPLSRRMQARVGGEARFLRAWYYQQLLVCFGGIPIIDDKVFGITDVINVPRTSYANCVAYLTAELDALAQVLPAADGSNPNPAAAPYTVTDYGRVTRGACLALKSRILLQAASPLFNGGAIAGATPAQAELAGYPSYSAARWQSAADAAKAVMDLNAYQLVVDNTTKAGYGFYSQFLQRFPNTEGIFTFNRPANRDMEGYYFPSSRNGARYSMPTQNIVDAFPMRNGRPITDPASGYNATRPYANRDPRFNYTIIYNTSSVFLASAGRPAPVYTYVGAPADGFDATIYTTGYYCRKMCDTATASTTARGWPLIRYAEVVLNYAEALNELGRTPEAMTQIFALRRRAGITAGADGRYGIAPGINQTDARTLIRNERRIELAYEDHRWNDIRRWKIGPDVNNGFNTRMSIRLVSGTPTASPVWSYTPTPSIRKHNFRPEMYLMPIPDAEIRKVPLFIQNPGW